MRAVTSLEPNEIPRCRYAIARTNLSCCDKDDDILVDKTELFCDNPVYARVKSTQKGLKLVKQWAQKKQSLGVTA